MSQEWINYGYGFNVSAFEPTLKGINKLILKAPETINLYFPNGGNKFRSLDEVEELSDEYGDGYYYIGASLWGPFLTAVRELENIHLIWANNFEGENFIMFPQMLPWNMNEKEKSLTIDKLDAILKKYLTIYCGTWYEDDRNKFMHLSVENGC